MTWPPPGTRKVAVPYHHQETDLQHVYLAVTAARRPAESDWKAAYRDVDHSGCRPHLKDGHRNCTRVVFVRVPDDVAGRVWLRDRDGERATRQRV